MSASYLLLIALMVGGITFCLRALPFMTSLKLQSHPFFKKLIQYLPLAIMIYLVIYAAGLPKWQSFSDGYREILSILLVIVVHLMFRSLILSVLLGTVFYMTMLHFT